MDPADTGLGLENRKLKQQNERADMLLTEAMVALDHVIPLNTESAERVRQVRRRISTASNILRGYE